VRVDRQTGENPSTRTRQAVMPDEHGIGYLAPQDNAVIVRAAAAAR
jgi:hypothetical protein